MGSEITQKDQVEETPGKDTSGPILVNLGKLTTTYGLDAPGRPDPVIIASADYLRKVRGLAPIAVNVPENANGQPSDGSNKQLTAEVANAAAQMLALSVVISPPPIAQEFQLEALRRGPTLPQERTPEGNLPKPVTDRAQLGIGIGMEGIRALANSPVLAGSETARASMIEHDKAINGNALAEATRKNMAQKIGEAHMILREMANRPTLRPALEKLGINVTDLTNDVSTNGDSISLYQYRLDLAETLQVDPTTLESKPIYDAPTSADWMLLYQAKREELDCRGKTDFLDYLRAAANESEISEGLPDNVKAICARRDAVRGCVEEIEAQASKKREANVSTAKDSIQDDAMLQSLLETSF